MAKKYKPGQLITIGKHVFRIKKDMHACDACKHNPKQSCDQYIPCNYCYQVFKNMISSVGPYYKLVLVK